MILVLKIKRNALVSQGSGVFLRGGVKRHQDVHHRFRKLMDGKKIHEMTSSRFSRGFVWCVSLGHTPLPARS